MPEIADPPPNAPIAQSTRDEATARTRRGLLGSLAVSLGAALIIVLLWLITRGAPSAGTDPNLTPPAYAPTRPAPTATP